MSEQGTPPVPAGWYPDPENPARGRWWNGVAWTDQVHTPGQPFPVPPALTAPAGTPWQTAWLWLIVFVPLLAYLPLLFIPWSAFSSFDPNRPESIIAAEFAIFLSPAYLLAIVLSWAIYGFSVFFAARDVRELTARGVPRPFHWAFAFLGGLVYTIGRSVVVHRRTGHGYAAIWAEVGVFAVGIVVALVVAAQAMSAILAAIPGYSG